MEPTIQALTPIAEAFDDLSIPYFVGGSVASSHHSRPRITNDVDLVADVQVDHAQLLQDRLSADYYVDAQMIRDAILRKTSFNFIHFGTGIKVDVFTAKDTPLIRLQMQHVQFGVLTPGGRQFRFASPEDTILSKLDWYRLGGGVSDRQWADIQQVLDFKRDTIDLVYLREGAALIGISDLLDRALSEAGR